MRYFTAVMINAAIVALLIVFGCGEKKGEAEAAPERVAPRKVSERAGSDRGARVEERAAEKTPEKAAVEETTEAEEKDGEEEAAEVDEEAGEDEAVGDPELAETDGIMLESLILAKGVEKRQPVDEGTEFSLGDLERLYAIMTVANPEQTESQVSVAWAPVGGGKERGKVSVSVGAQKRWRTWAFTRTLNRPGRWEAIVRDVDGEVIGRAPFTLIP